MFKKGLLYISCIALVVSFFATVIYSQLSRAFELVRRESELTKQIEIEQKKQDELNFKLEYYETDDFVEQVAREQLGFIKHDEIIFIREKNN